MLWVNTSSIMHIKNREIAGSRESIDSIIGILQILESMLEGCGIMWSVVAIGKTEWRGSRRRSSHTAPLPRPLDDMAQISSLKEGHILFEKLPGAAPGLCWCFVGE